MSDSKKNTITPTTITPTKRFGVDWASQETQTLSNGGRRMFIHLPATIFKVIEAPPEYFGQNVSEFGWDDAIEMAGNAECYDSFEFGACVIERGSVFRADDGFWYCKLVPTRRRRVKIHVHEEYEDGTSAIVPKSRTESWILTRLDQIQPMPSHPESGVYRQRDTLLEKQRSVAQASEDALVVNERKKSARTKRRRLNLREIAEEIWKQG